MPTALEAAMFLQAGQYTDYSAWKRDFFREYYELLATTISDNTDHFRFPERSDSLFMPSWHHAEFATLSANLEAAFVTRRLFADDASRALFDRLLLFRLLGQTHVRLPLYQTFKTLEAETLAALEVSSHRELSPPTALVDVSVTAFDRLFHVRCLPINILQTFFVHQYYVDRPALKIAPRPGDQVVDVGACFGDTALLFAHSVGEAGRIYAFEMVPNHLRIISQNAEKNPDLAGRIKVFAAALGDEKIEVAPAAGLASTQNGRIDPGARYDASLAPCWRLDDLVDDGRVEKVDFLKLDVEGAEPKVLHGAARTIARDRPVLAISVYHSLVDLIHIPQMIAALDLDYDLYLEHYTIHAEETILFAVPRAKSGGAKPPSQTGGDQRLATAGTGEGDKPWPTDDPVAAYWQARQKQTELELDAFRNEIGREAEALRAHIAQLTDNVAEQASQATNWREAHGSLEKVIATLRNEVLATKEAEAKLHEAIRGLQTELQGILSSSTWRATAPVRDYLTARPHIKRYARRTAKLLWWTASGQLFSDLRARRSRCIRSKPPHP